MLTVTSAQLLEEVEVDEPAASPAPATSPAPAAAAPAAGEKMEDVPPADAAAAAPKSEDKMEDAAAASAASPSNAADKKKVKIRREDLKVESFSTGGLDQAQLNAYFEREVAMATQVRDAHCMLVCAPLSSSLPCGMLFL